MGSASIAVVGLALLAGLAPFQCGGSDPDAPSRIEDSPGDALYRLASEFEAAGDRPGRVRVLRFLITRYPKNRHAAAAREDLKQLGEQAPDEAATAPAAGSTPTAPPASPGP